MNTHRYKNNRGPVFQHIMFCVYENVFKQEFPKNYVHETICNIFGQMVHDNIFFFDIQFWVSSCKLLYFWTLQLELLRDIFSENEYSFIKGSFLHPN